MKNINLALVLFLFLFLGLAHPKVYAQAPGITYQAVIMSPDGKALPGSNDLNSHLADQEICLRFSFKNASGENEYEEVIQTKTDAFGMVNVIIGTGNRMGGSATSFGQIKWSNQSKFLDVALDKNGACSEFIAISTQQFTAVPFALFAANSGNTGPMGPAGPPGASGAAGLRGQAGTNGLTASTATFVDLSTDQSVGGTKIFTNPITGSLTGNAGTATLAAEATKLATARTINGIPFDGSASITLPVATESITGIVPIAKGGTNSTAAATAGGVGYGTGTAHAYTITGTAGQMLSSTGAGTPTWVAATVPYTGATGPVNLGGFDLKANGVTVGRGGENVAPNTAIGFQTLRNNTTGQSNTAIGYDALRNNTTGPLNTGTGKDALYSNTTGSYNNANGVFALYYNIDGNNNNALGMQELFENKTGDQNTALGTSALGKTLVSDNTAVGYYAGNANTSGANNSFVGTRAGGFNTTGANNTFIGGGSNTTEGNTLSNATALGAGAVVAAANTIQLGNTSVTSVKTSGTLTAGAITYPNTAGAANAVLTTDGSGIASWNVPSASGVPYMGATGAVNLGGFDLTVNGMTVGEGGGSLATNTAIGARALRDNTIGFDNTAIGINALRGNLKGA